MANKPRKPQPEPGEADPKKGKPKDGKRGRPEQKIKIPTDFDSALDALLAVPPPKKKRKRR